MIKSKPFKNAVRAEIRRAELALRLRGYCAQGAMIWRQKTRGETPYKRGLPMGPAAPADVRYCLAV